MLQCQIYTVVITKEHDNLYYTAGFYYLIESINIFVLFFTNSGAS